MPGKMSLWDQLKETEILGGLANAIGRGYTRFFGSRNDRVIDSHLYRIAECNDHEPRYEALSDEELRGETTRLRQLLEEKIAAANGDKLLDEVRRLRGEFRSDEATEACKKYRKVENAALDEILPLAFAAMREATKRQLRIRHYDVQLLGGLFLHQDRIAEMITGEGKTLVANLPCYLNGIPGLGVHVITVNDYLAQRDCDWNAPIFRSLGMSIGCIHSQMMTEPRREAYACDITYGTSSEFGFDYLRDNMKVELVRQVQGRFRAVEGPEGKARLQRSNQLNSVLGNLNYAIVDEVDSILIDEARTPLIISGDAMQETDAYYTADAIARRLRGCDKNVIDKELLEHQGDDDARERIENQWDFVYTEKDRSVYMTETGITKAEKLLGRGSLYDPQNHDWPHYLEQALCAHNLYKRDVQYVADDGEVVIIDENTGRKMVGRTWSDGLHQAIEAKEGLKIKRESQTLATITLQNYFRLYGKRAGMTGTAMTEAAEFMKIYKLDVVAMPTNWPLRRANFSDVIYRTLSEKFRAICAEVEAVHAMGRPVLVGTVTIENSERIAGMLARRGIKHDVLNAKQHEREASIIEVAGQLGRVTIATNMAGRGTDIVLGAFTEQELLDYWKSRNAAPKSLKLGDPEFYDKLIEHQQKRTLSTGVSLYEEWDHRGFLSDLEYQGKPYRAVPLCTRINAFGGLHILGSERHESRRIDNQLRGRCGRQGDPGSSRFYLSLEDDLMRIFASDRVSKLLNFLGMEEGQEISAPMVNRAVENAQKKVESHHFDIRKNLLEYDGVMDEQRKLIYGERQYVLESSDLQPLMQRWLRITLDAALDRWANKAITSYEWELAPLCEWAKKKFDFRIFPKDLDDKDREELQVLLWDKIEEVYLARRSEVGAEDFTELERFLLLEKIDEKWKDHLHAMDQLRSSIGMVSYAQEDPKVKYKANGYKYFEEMWENIADEISDLLFRVRLVSEQELTHQDHWGITSETSSESQAPQSAGEQSPAEADTGSQLPQRREQPKVSRNAPCPCGSGKKFKKCCGQGA